MAKRDKILSSLYLGLIVLMGSCVSSTESTQDLLPSSSGKYGEVLVVVDTSLSNGPIGEKLDEIFFKALEATPQKEASFRKSTVDPSSFKSILKRSRNLLRISVEKKNSNKIKIDRNVWAKDQLLINIYASSDTAALRMLHQNSQRIRDYYNQEELTRLIGQYKHKPNKDLMAEIKKSYGIDLLIPPAYVMMERDSSSFWIRKEKSIGEHSIIQGLIFYTQPYQSDSTFTPTYMQAQRNERTMSMIEGARDNSFMQVYSDFVPISKEVNLNGLYAVEYKGLWNMKNDFMGGPFLHYTLVDEAKNRVIDLDVFVYAPKFNKREYLRELEAIIQTLQLN